LPLLEHFGIARAEEVAIATLAERLRAEAARGGGLAPCAYVGAWACLP
jgi:hypothetical protein